MGVSDTSKTQPKTGDQSDSTAITTKAWTCITLPVSTTERSTIWPSALDGMSRNVSRFSPSPISCTGRVIRNSMQVFVVCCRQQEIWDTLNSPLKMLLPSLDWHAMEEEP